MTETNQVSLHQVKIYEFVKSCGKDWTTSKNIAKCTSMSDRTVRQHCLRLVKMGVFDQVQVYPRYRYRLSAFAGKRNKTYVQRLESAREAFGPDYSPC